jgi:hypothetical protein
VIGLSVGVHRSSSAVLHSGGLCRFVTVCGFVDKHAGKQFVMSLGPRIAAHSAGHPVVTIAPDQRSGIAPRARRRKLMHQRCKADPVT